MYRNEETEYAIYATSGELIYRNDEMWLLAPEEWEDEFTSEELAALPRIYE